MISRNCERNALLELRGEEGAGERDRVHASARQEGSECKYQIFCFDFEEPGPIRCQAVKKLRLKSRIGHTTLTVSARPSSLTTDRSAEVLPVPHTITSHQTLSIDSIPA